MDPHQTADLEAQKPPERKDEKCDIKDDEPDTITAGALSSGSPRPSVNTDSRDHASASKSDTKDNNSTDPDTGGISQTPKDNPFRNERMAAVMCDGVLFFESLTKMNILILQNNIGEVQNNIISAKISGEDKIQCARRLEDLLHRYTTAIRDYDYMRGLDDSSHSWTKFVFSVFDIVFPSSYPHKKTIDKWIGREKIGIKNLPTRSIPPSDPLRRLLSKILPARLAWTKEELAKLEPISKEATFLNKNLNKNENENKNIVKPKMISPFVDGLARFIVAITGGLSLVVPMLIMRLHQDSNKRLITTSVAVVLLSGVLSVGFRASNAETLGITAAYAAVLVVFVGTSV